MAKKKSPNKWATWGKGVPCNNCGLAEYRFIQTIFIDEPKHEKLRFLHFYCVHCLCERLKLCDVNEEQLKTKIKEHYGIRKTIK